jgi:hypothetical protein
MVFMLFGLYLGVFEVPEASQTRRPCRAQASRAAASTQARQLCAAKRAQQVTCWSCLLFSLVLCCFYGVLVCVYVFWWCQKPPEEDGPAGPKQQGCRKHPSQGATCPQACATGEAVCAAVFA